MELTTPYAFGKTMDASFGEAEEKVRTALAREGFGVLTEIDMKEKFRAKLGREFRNYKILGTCNPALAWEAVAREINIGALLPCNVVLYTTDDGRTAVVVMDPVAALGMIGNPEMTEMARSVRGMLERVLAAV